MAAGSYVVPPSEALLRRIAELRGIPNSRAYQDFRAEARRIVIEGNAEAVMEGKDGMGHAVAPLMPSTLKYRRGSGPPRAPRGRSSRIVTLFRADWRKEGPDWVLDRGWYGFAAKDGRPIPLFFNAGTRTMARRDLSQISPKARDRVWKRHYAFLELITRPSR